MHSKCTPKPDNFFYKALQFWPAIALSVFVLACGKASRPESPSAPLVKVCSTLDGSDIPLELRGIVVSEGRLRLGFKASGIIGSIRVREGDTVRAGQVLATLDGIDARTQALSTRSILDRAQREAGRAERLAADGIIPSNDRENALNQLETAEAQWRQALDGLKRTQLTAPASGTIFQRLAEPGEAVSSGSPVVVMDTTNQPVIRTGVSERELACLKVNQETAITPEDGSPTFRGRVRSLGATPNGEDGLYPVEILPERKILRPGALLKLRFEGRGEPGIVHIPFPALVHRQDKNYVFVVGANLAVRARSVDVVGADGIGVILRQGLLAGERIVSEGAYFLEDGQVVRILE
jgi:membrane fusion protein, multidrug efflux system